jgi:hypothetical protein
MSSSQSTQYASTSTSAPTPSNNTIVINYYRLNTQNNDTRSDTEIKQLVRNKLVTELSPNAANTATIIIEENPKRILVTLNQVIDDATHAKITNSYNDDFRDYACSANVSCPLASVLSSHTEMADKWGDNHGECVRVTGGGTCARCPPGTYVDYSNTSSVCSKCPYGQDSKNYNSLDCLPCADGANCFNDPVEKAGVKLDGSLDKVIDTIYIHNIDKLKQTQTLDHRLNKAQEKYDTYKELNMDDIQMHLKNLQP